MFVIFDRSPADALALRQRLYRYHIHSLYLAPDEIDRIADYPVHGILIPHPELLIDPIGLATLLRERFPRLPLAMLHNQGGPNFYHLQRASDLIFEGRVTTPKMITDLYAAYEGKGNPSVQSCISDCVLTDSRSRYVYILGEPFPASHIQWMLVRYLTLAAPRPVPAEELAALCFSPGHERAAQNVSAHLTKLDRVISRGFPFRVFSCQHPHVYSIKRTFYR